MDDQMFVPPEQVEAPVMSDSYVGEGFAVTAGGSSIDTDPLSRDCRTSASSGHYAIEFLEKVHCVRYILSVDIIACDAKWTLFVAAAFSYRYTVHLLPFPPAYSSEKDGCNIHGLIRTISDTPPLRLVHQMLVDEDYDGIKTNVIDLLHWVLVSRRYPIFRTINYDEIENILDELEANHKFYRPTYIFKICPSANSKVEARFQREKEIHNTKYAFHGNRLDHFYSTIHRSNGEKLILSPKMSDMQPLSPPGAGWGASMCGTMLTCVGICEYIDNPELWYVERKTDLLSMEIFSMKPQTARVRYLLVYGNNFQQKTVTKKVLAWLHRHEYPITLGLYLMALGAIGIANNDRGTFLKNWIIRSTNYLWNFYRKLLRK